MVVLLNWRQHLEWEDEMVNDLPQKVAALKALFGTPGWGVVSATLEELIVQDLNTLSLLKRPEGVADDFLRGRIDMAKIVLGRFKQEVRTFELQQKEKREADQRESEPRPASIFAPPEGSTPSD